MTDDELIAALETAEGPSRELDRQIAISLGWERRASRIDPDKLSWRCDRLNIGWTVECEGYPPDYTGSIDAAITVVPAGWQWGISCGVGGYLAKLYEPISSTSITVSTPGIASAAHAICVAALRARAASKS